MNRLSTDEGESRVVSQASQPDQASTPDTQVKTLVLRSTFGGFLMGLANLVPGISGGTMLLAAGIYPNFVAAVAELTRVQFRYRSLLVLACVVGAALLSILLLAGTLRDLVLDYRWVMYSLFIGLTLGGVPVVWKLVKRPTPGLAVAALAAFLVMAALSMLQVYGVVGQIQSGPAMFFVAGLAGASAMILPGLSGGYLLLLMGQYVPILSAIDDFKTALNSRDLSAAMSPAFSVMLPVGLGVLAGVALVGNLLQWLLKHYQKPTLGALLGLLIGSTVGLWPFQEGVPPLIGDFVKGQQVTGEMIDHIDKEDWPIRYFSASPLQACYALLLIGLGFGITTGVARFGSSETESSTSKLDAPPDSPSRKL